GRSTVTASMLNDDVGIRLGTAWRQDRVGEHDQRAGGAAFRKGIEHIVQEPHIAKIAGVEGVPNWGSRFHVSDIAGNRFLPVALLVADQRDLISVSEVGKQGGPCARIRDTGEPLISHKTVRATSSKQGAPARERLDGWN